MNKDLRGEDILRLLNDFPLEPLIDVIERIYDEAHAIRIKNPERAILLCKEILESLKFLSKQTLPNVERFVDSSGRSNLLLASIYLNLEEELEKAEVHFRESRSAYHRMQRDHFESLACLGLAITLRKLGRIPEASEACENAHDKAVSESIPPRVNISDLCEAIEQERVRIQALLQHQETVPPDERIPAPGERKEFMVFDITSGKDIIDAHDTTDLYLLSEEDYLKHAQVEYVTLDLVSLSNLRKEAKSADYILKIEHSTEIGDELSRGDLIFIRQQAYCH